MDHSDIAQTCAALAQGKRLAILRLLHGHRNGMVVGEIAARLGLRQNSVSSHLRILAHCDLVFGHRFGREIRYRALPHRLAQLELFLSSVLTADRDACL
jgi:ArsR family transcriptional regulator, arsenate/arsenite/antimonite-responsive transcriptional repressor